MLGARGNLQRAQGACKWAPTAFLAICGHFLKSSTNWPIVPHAPKVSDHEFAEPVALSSIVPGDFPLARTTAGFDFDLLALRARRGKNVSRRTRRFKRGEVEKTPLFANVPWGKRCGFKDA